MKPFTNDGIDWKIIDVIRTIKSSSSTDNWNKTSELVILLLRWRESLIPGEVALLELMELLKRQNLNCIADSLHSKYHETSSTLILGAPVEKRDLIANEAAIKKQKDHVTCNLPVLMESLSYTPMLIAQLLSKGILTSDQASDLNHLPANSMKAFTLFDYIKKRLNPDEPTLYYKVLSIFITLQQGYVVYILKKILPQT